MNFGKRSLTALVLLGLLFLLIQYGGRILTFLVLQAVIAASLMEFYNLAARKRLEPQKTLGLVLTFGLGVVFFFRSVVPIDVALFGILFLFGVYFLFRFTRLEHLPYLTQSLTVTFFGILYLGMTLNYLFLIRFEWGPFYVYFLCAAIFLGDTGAFLIGKWLGRHRMTPLASPNKTWEGSAGGILFAVLGAWAARQLLFPHAVLWRALLAGALIHAVAQVSDPLESLFKRAVGVKDSSNLLPGHGGVLDRIDSLILGSPFFYFFLRYFWP